MERQSMPVNDTLLIELPGKCSTRSVWFTVCIDRRVNETLKQNVRCSSASQDYLSRADRSQSEAAAQLHSYLSSFVNLPPATTLSFPSTRSQGWLARAACLRKSRNLGAVRSVRGRSRSRATIAATANDNRDLSRASPSASYQNARESRRVCVRLRAAWRTERGDDCLQK